MIHNMLLIIGVGTLSFLVVCLITWLEHKSYQRGIRKDYERMGILPIVLLIVSLSACAPTAKPSAQQQTYQGSPTVIISPECRENCGGNTVTTGQTTSTAQTASEQPTEQTHKDSMWIFWTIAFAVATVGGYLIWKKYKK